ncbi:alpha/beta hydrolase [Glaciecola siphonariae]|uniref:Alpha/beta hydrolase n=1 Tax=Glaciecola siphonariae TaxID=521012 RepID=A0ABV9LTT9_9ALTE
MRSRVNKPLLAAFFVLCLTGCESLVMHQLLSSSSYSAVASVTAKLKSEFDIQTREFCDTELGCYRYYFAANKSDMSKLELNTRVQFHEGEYASELALERKDLPDFHGSVVIVHGFRASKDWSLLSAAYFQFLGFDVYVLDLLGHGELDAPIGFGVKDADYIQRFIEAQVPKDKPIIALGNSIGGLVATYLANRDTVDAAILQAPMTQLGSSLQGYVRDTKPWFGFLLSDETLNNGATKALAERNLRPQQTDTVALLKQSHSPFLIFASNIDSGSPYSVFADIRANNIKVIEVDGVEHAYMSLIGQSEHDAIVSWLGSIEPFKELELQ